MKSEKPACFVFNGDSDGIIAQHLMEMAGVTPSIRVTGLKREIAILDRLPSLEKAEVFVFDINVGMNREALTGLLDRGISVQWFDHHEPGELPSHPRLKTHIQTAPGVCTAFLVHRELPGSDARWAAAAAYGDNLPETGDALLKPLGLSSGDTGDLRELGELINYNAYGETLEDVLYPPLEIAERMSGFTDALAFHGNGGMIPGLREQRNSDEARLAGLKPKTERGRARVFHLPAEPWARRLGGSFANHAAQANPEAGIAVLHPLSGGGYQVSIRSPRQRPEGATPASQLAKEFPTGGGRALAAGINRLPEADIPAFEKRFLEVYG